MSESGKRIDYITRMKTISMFIVIFAHCMLFFCDIGAFFPEGGDIKYTPAVEIFKYLDKTLVPTYVFSAGFVYVIAVQNKNRTMLQNVLHRARRLLRPYYLYGALWLVPLYTFFDIKTFGREPEHAGYLQGYKCMILGQFSDHMWFLWMLFWIFLFFIIFSELIKKRKLIILFFATLAMALVVSLFLTDFPYFKLSQIAPYLFVYYAGVVCYTYREKLESLSAWVHALLAILLFGILTLYFYLQRSYDLSHFLYNYAIQTIGALFMLFLFMALDKASMWKYIESTRAYAYLKKHSVEMYLLQMPFPYLYYRLFSPKFGSNPPLCIVLMFIHSLAAIVLVVQIKHMLIAIYSNVKGKLVH